ncbi:MAG: hypothetical protein JNL98_27805 [Bryobacterales bacterium]|nr:hypothetical protein [Bryobacterales bacterium]
MKYTRGWAWLTVGIFAGTGCFAETTATPDAAAVGLMRAEGMRRVQILHRGPVTDVLDAVVALGVPADRHPGGWWDGPAKLGIFLQHRSQPALIYRITVEAAPALDGECHATVERATSTDIVVFCIPEKGSASPNHKFVYDVRAKTLVKHVVSRRVAFSRVFADGSKAVLAGTDGRRLIFAEFDPPAEPRLRLLSGTAAERWARRVAASFDSSTGEGQTYFYFKPDSAPVDFGPGDTFRLTRDPNVSLVTERTGRTMRSYPFPKSTWDEFASARPQRVKNGYARGFAQFEERIGPHQVFNGVLWFGKTFYDSEGMTGIGGFGYFDTDQRRYRIYSPPPVRMRLSPRSWWSRRWCGWDLQAIANGGPSARVL